MGCGWSARDPGNHASYERYRDRQRRECRGTTGWLAAMGHMLNAGLRLTAIGGSDDHTADETRDRALGRPATIVYAEELSEPALLDGLRKGRVYIRTRGALGTDSGVRSQIGGERWPMGSVVPRLAGEIMLSANALTQLRASNFNGCGTGKCFRGAMPSMGVPPYSRLRLIRAIGSR